MRVLHVANFTRRGVATHFYNTDHKLSAGLTRLGCAVHNFSYRDVARLSSLWHSKRGGIGAMNRRLAETAAGLQPDLLLLGHAELVQPQTLAQLRADLPEMRVARWWVDSFEPHKMAAIGDLLPQVDTLFTSHGASYTRSTLADAGLTLPERIAWLPPLCDRAIENCRAFERKEHRFDLLFAGRPWPQRADLHTRLADLLPDYRLGLYGKNNDLLSGQAYMDAIGSARTGLNFSIYNDAPFYSSDRLAHLAGNGTLVISAQVPGLAELCADSGMVFFKSLDELPDLLAHWLRDERWRQAGEKSWQFAHQQFACERVCAWLLEVSTGKKAGQSWEWGAEISE